MKSIVILFAFLMQLTFAFSQQIKNENKKQYGLATGDRQPNRQTTPTGSQTSPTAINGSDQTYKNDCYSNFVFTVKNYGYDKDGGFYSWGIKVKNNYTKPVQLRYKLIVGNDNPKYGTLTYCIKPGETYANDYGTAMALIVKNSSTQYRVEVSEVCFEGQDCHKNGYLDCNMKQAGNSVSDAKASNNQQGSSNTNIPVNGSSGHQNDLTEYNRSKADLERQMTEQNANAQKKSQNYTIAMNAGISAHNSGNYVEARRQFSVALNNSNTDEARAKAQEYYNKTASLEKSQATINAAGNLAATTINAIDDISKSIRANKERKKIEEEVKIDNKQQLITKNKAHYIDVTSMDNDELGVFTDYFVSKMEKEG